MTGETAAVVDGWRSRLAGSRAALLRALEGVTEREFAAPFEGDRSLVQVLAELAVEERRAVAQARGEDGGARLPAKPLAPQVVHDLAGARYQTQRLIDDAGEAPTPGTLERVATVVEAVARREEAVADRLAARPRA